MTLADALSRMPNPTDKSEVPLDVRVDAIDIGTNIQHSIALINFSQEQELQLKE